MFNSNFKEKEQTVIPLEDIVYSEFLELLSIIYPMKRRITGCCFGLFVTVSIHRCQRGNYFQTGGSLRYAGYDQRMQGLLDVLLIYLTSQEIVVGAKAWVGCFAGRKFANFLIENFSFVFKDVCVKQCRSFADLQKLAKEPEYKLLSDRIKVRLQDNMLDAENKLQSTTRIKPLASSSSDSDAP